jgi:ketosteroid isomerase-like protein
MRYLVGQPGRQSRDARPSAAIGAFAVGALAVGAYAIGALAIGRLTIRKARIRELEIDKMTVGAMHAERSSDFGGDDIAKMTAGVAEEYAALCRRGEFDEAMAQLFSPDHVRVEPTDVTGPPTEVHGLEAIEEHSRGFAQKYKVHGIDIADPLVGGDQFAVRFLIDAAIKRTRKRVTIRKVELCTVRDGRIVQSEVYYNAS